MLQHLDHDSYVHAFYNIVNPSPEGIKIAVLAKIRIMVENEWSPIERVKGM